ncbi:hypothetical protein MUO79_10105, partial [Candidatus Bathyarchaeota archaeon]|nr:hypothetical protein [Candidatus Bathyarchaeota archaeon]
MKTKQAFLVIMLILLSVADLGTAFDTFPVRAGSCEGRRTYIDVFTQKPRYNGEGHNQPSDMFGPQDLVVLYALVRINTEPVAGKLVSYEITGPQGTDDLKFYRVAGTNASGISETLFSLRAINQTDAFGIWTVVARIDVAGQQYTDTLTFEVNWLIELISARTLDGNLTERSTFGLEGYVGVEITVRNNAWTPKTTRLGVTLFDEVNVPINSFEITNLTIPPDGKDWHIYGKLYIPKFGAPGKAWITVVALDGGGTAYCPEISTVFWITILNPIQVNFIDGAVFLEVWPMKAEPGEVIAIAIGVRNEGTVTLNDLNVTLTGDGLPPVSRLISSLGPYAFSSFHENWNTSGMSEGNFTIRAELQTFPHEADTSDNTYTATVELESKPVCTHDIQVTSVISSTYEACQGQTVDIRVAVRNNGNSTEATNVRAYYDAHLIYGQSIGELAPESEQVLIFHWNTIGVPEGIYQISATATPVEGETNTADNTYVDGLIRIKICPQTVQDVAVIALSASPNDTIAGTPVTITAKVKNLGSLTESFVLKFFYDSEQIGESYASDLAPNEERDVAVIWYTTGIPEGSYVMKAYIPPLPDETNTENNLYVDGTVLIRTAYPPTAKHDVAVIAVNASAYHAYTGDSIETTVMAANFGDFPETFNVTLYANALKIGTRNFLHLGPNLNTTLSFAWNTSGLSAGNYTLWAFADYVPGETDSTNNLFVDGTVMLLTPPVPPDHHMHDVAVIAVQPERQSVFIGEEVEVHVRVKNLGNATQSFNVNLYYDSTST